MSVLPSKALEYAGEEIKWC